MCVNWLLSIVKLRLKCLRGILLPKSAKRFTPKKPQPIIGPGNWSLIYVPAGGIMKMRLSKSIVGNAEAEAVSKVICEDGYLGMGATTREFEADLAMYLGVETWQVVSVNSGTAALQLAVQAAMVAAGKKASDLPEILVPSLTFVASFQAVSAMGCVPVPCDVLENTGTLDLEDAARRLTDKTIAVMHVDYASNPWKIDRVYDFAKSHGLRVIDDAAHAFGCRHHGHKIGSFGDLVCFSFDGIKNITCGEGGCLVAFDEASAAIAADSRLLGVRGDTAKRFSGARSWDPDVTLQGFRFHLSNIMAAIGRVQLGRLEGEFIPARRALYEQYRRHLEQMPAVRMLETDPADFIVPHIMPVRVPAARRDEIVTRLDAGGIPTGMHYKPNHLLTLFASGAPSLPHAEKLYDELVTLPLHPGLSANDVGLVCGQLQKAMDS